ncbi:MAG: hypothetical protein Q7Q73_16360 [Verrucomicrobiota bacterium JB024]|nr:hypothetical protein [Verrucomicrobiota bacterium JB024]
MAEGADDATVRKLADLVTEGGFKWVTDYLTIGNARSMTPEQVQARFDPLPPRCVQYAELLREADVSLLVRLDPFPWEPWNGAAEYSYEEDSPDMQRAAAFVRACVRQLKPYVNHWQIWNEPNIGNQAPHITPENYVKVVRFLAGIICREQPDAVIYGPGTAMLQCLDEYPYPWIPRALEAGLADEIDVFSYHPYRAPAWRHNIPENASQFYPWTWWEDYRDQVADLRQQIRDHNDGYDLPLATTEDGLTNVIDGNGEQQISWVVGAKYELRRALLDFELGVYPRTQFCLYRPARELSYDKQATFSIVTADFQKKPQYLASQNLNAVLDSRYTLDEDAPVTVEVTGPRRTLSVNPHNPQESVTSSDGSTTAATPPLYQQVYRRETPEFEEMLVFFWSAEPSGDVHIRYPARMEITEQGWQAPLQIDLMAMPAKRPKNEIVELIRSDFVDRRDPEQLQALATPYGVLLRDIEVRDYPLLIKWIRPKTIAH